MKTIAIISEYNPFHKGHKYHIEAAKEQFNADNIVCIMSGSFVQRGEPAMFDKWSRAKMALYGGADLVIELPFVYSCQPAELFAFGAVNILNNLGIIDGICFGSEIGETAILKSVAELLLNEPEDFSKLVKQYLKLGTTYPRSVSLALEAYYKDNFHADSHIWENPNNILGIEYIKSIIQLKSPMLPYTIKRVENNYNDENLTKEIASATAIRNEIKRFGLSEKLKLNLPQTSFDIIQQDILKSRAPIYIDSLSDILLYRIRTMKAEQLQEYISHKEGIEFRIKKAADQATCLEELIEGIKTKRYTRAFIQRLLCHILMGLNWEASKAFKQSGIPSYARVLGFNDKGKQLLRSISNASQFPIINKVADFKVDNPILNNMFDYDLRATDIYNLARPDSSCKRAGEDYLNSPIYI